MTHHAENSRTQYRPVTLCVVAVGLLLSLFATPVYGLQAGGNVLLGATIAAINFWLTVRSITALLTSASGERNAAGWGLAVAVKFSVLCIGMYLLFQAPMVQGLPLLVGLGALPLGIVVAQLFSLQVRES